MELNGADLIENAKSRRLSQKAQIAALDKNLNRCEIKRIARYYGRLERKKYRLEQRIGTMTLKHPCVLICITVSLSLMVLIPLQSPDPLRVLAEFFFSPIILLYIAMLLCALLAGNLIGDEIDENWLRNKYPRQLSYFEEVSSGIKYPTEIEA